MKENLLSIIVPVYNVEKYICRCLDSIVNQTYNNIEIIIVNDGSTDKSEEIISKYKTMYPKKIKSFKKKNGGLSDARNYGIEASTGEYIAFIDSDDYITPDFCEKMYKKMKKENLDIVCCDTIKFWDNNKTQYVKTNMNFSKDKTNNYLISLPMACCRMYKTSIFKTNKFKKDILYEDLELVLTLALQNVRVDFINEGLYFYYQREESIMNQKNFSPKLLDIFKVLSLVEQKFLQSNKYKMYQQELEYLFITHLLRSATLRFLDYKNTKEQLISINKIIKNKFPKWNKNKYYQKSSYKLKTICFLAYHKQYLLLKIIKKYIKKV